MRGSSSNRPPRLRLTGAAHTDTKLKAAISGGALPGGAAGDEAGGQTWSSIGWAIAGLLQHKRGIVFGARVVEE